MGPSRLAELARTVSVLARRASEPLGVALKTGPGKLNGRQGSFILTHLGTTTPSAQNPSVTVVPGSGTGELAGLSGTMAIDITDGKHFYALTYEV